MEAFILAAGLGTRLRPLTNDRPKALVEVGGRTLLEINIERLARQGIGHIVVNVHHFADMMKDYIESHDWPVKVDISDESDLLLDTGGAIAHAAQLFDGASRILVHNVDILSDIDVLSMMNYAERTGAYATLAVSRRKSSRQLLFVDSMLVGWHNLNTNEYLWSDLPVSMYEEMAFSGIALIDPHLPQELASTKKGAFPIIPEYLRLAKDNVINAFEHDFQHWLDVGKPETLSMAERFVM